MQQYLEQLHHISYHNLLHGPAPSSMHPLCLLQSRLDSSNAHPAGPQAYLSLSLKALCTGSLIANKNPTQVPKHT